MTAGRHPPVLMSPGCRRLLLAIVSKRATTPQSRLGRSFVAADRCLISLRVACALQVLLTGQTLRHQTVCSESEYGKVHVAARTANEGDRSRILSERLVSLTCTKLAIQPSSAQVQVCGRNSPAGMRLFICALHASWTLQCGPLWGGNDYRTRDQAICERFALSNEAYIHSSAHPISAEGA